MKDEKLNITCPTCGALFKRRKSREQKHPLSFCAYCGNRLHIPPPTDKKRDEFEEKFSSICLPSEQEPKGSEIQMTIGHYQILKSIGKGGMGEVFLAYDTVSGRKIALKRIRQDLISHPQLQNRFLREARITSQLMHPTIVPIYSIHHQDQLVYYTMPFVEGETLRQLLRKAKDVEKKHDAPKDPHSSIPALIRIFLQVCQACAYAHHLGVIHRDLKPENFMIGKYGQVLILDWGLAKMIHSDAQDAEQELDELTPSLNLQRITKVGKVVGTIAYMAPERALGEPATIQTDIYSLGVILYQILTLTIPFHRKNLEYFKRHWMKEHLIPPELIAPYREVPQILSEVAKKCLATDPKARYHSIDELIQSLENYIEGRSEWFPIRTLDTNNKTDWEFQEHILIAEHTAITRATDVSDWVNLMISKDSFPNNTKIEADVKILPSSHGIGFLFSLPEAIERKDLTEGYCLWIASPLDAAKKTKLARSSVSLIEAPEIMLKPNEWQHISIEKIEGHIYFYLNGILQFSYVNHIPIVGTHIGILTKDADFEIKNFEISIGSQNITISCLAVPDAFLASKDYERALSEYRRIGAAFPGSTEGREALFRAGITLLEQAKTEGEMRAKELYNLSYNEFSNLRNTAGAPLEYLGKALIYETLKEHDEEIKCYEMGLRRYKRHPLIPILEEQIAFRMHESARQNRKVAYEFISLAIRFLPVLTKSHATSNLFKSLELNWEVPHFIHHIKDSDEELQKQIFRLNLSFWLAKPYLFKETVDELLQRPILPKQLIADSLFLMIELGAISLATTSIKEIRSLLSEAEQNRLTAAFSPLERIITIATSSITGGIDWFLNHKTKKLTKEDERVLFFLLRKAINEQKLGACSDLLREMKEKKLQVQHSEYFDALLVEVYLFLRDYESVEEILHRHAAARTLDEASLLYFPYGGYLAHKEGEKQAIAHFSKLLETPYPRSWLLGAHFLAGNIHLDPGGWVQRAFLWEKRRLYEQLALFYFVTGGMEKSTAFHMLAAKEYVHE